MPPPSLISNWLLILLKISCTCGMTLVLPLLRFFLLSTLWLKCCLVIQCHWIVLLPIIQCYYDLFINSMFCYSHLNPLVHYLKIGIGQMYFSSQFPTEYLEPFKKFNACNSSGTGSVDSFMCELSCLSISYHFLFL